VISCSFMSTLCGRSSDSQAPYSLPLPSSWLNQCSLELSFLFTAAGQFRTFTGFPFKLNSIELSTAKYLEYKAKEKVGQIGVAARQLRLSLRGNSRSLRYQCGSQPM
jgi:hypothetical protein